MTQYKILAAVLIFGTFAGSVGQSGALAAVSQVAIPDYSVLENAVTTEEDVLHFAQAVKKHKGPAAGPKPKRRADPGPSRNRDVDVDINKDVNVNRIVNVRVVNRPRGWRGRHWGAVVFGVTLGTLIVVAANTPPPLPDESVCWTWTNDARTEGFWYYCDGD